MKSFQLARVAQSDEWLTPRWLLRPLGEFDLDPCSPLVRPWPTAARHLTREDNGLACGWEGRVWLNPPFGAAAAEWMRRMSHHGDGIALIPARTETRMFFESVWGMAAAVLFVSGRVKFCSALGIEAKLALNAPVVLVAYGRENADVLASSKLGHCVPLRRRRVVPAKKGLFS